MTGKDGRFWFPALPPGDYTVRADLRNFRPDRKTATVSLDATSTVEFALEPAVEEAVRVAGQAPSIDVTSTTSGTNYTTPVIEKLPVARNYADVVRSNPGIDTDLGETQGRALALAIHGATSAENLWIIDGVNTTSVLKGLQGKAINNEFVDEVEVKTGGYPAEYGGALGGVVNVITKSGGNVFHGDGFLYYDSSGTSASQKFTDADSQVVQMRFADYDRFDFGADLGGFLVKDRLWFFAAYDRVRFDSDVSRVSPTPLVSVDDRFPLDTTDDLYSGKLTWNIASRATAVATVFADPSRTSGASGADPRQNPSSLRFEPPVILNPDPATWFSDRRVGGTDYGLRVTVLPGATSLFTLQGSHHRDRNQLTAADGIRTIDFTCAGGTPDNPCAPPPAPKLVTGGYGTIDGPLDHNQGHRDQIWGDVTFDAGNHELKAGGGYEKGSGDAIYSYTGGQEVTIRSEFGQTYYQHSFAAVSAADLTPISQLRLQSSGSDYAAYVQDSWKPARGLTVNLGLRWAAEYIRDYTGATVLPLTNQWQPRFGVAWDPGGDGVTKLYAFGGRFSYTLPVIGTALSFNSITLAYTYNFDPVSLVQDPSVINHPAPIVWFGGGPAGDSVDAGIRGFTQDEFTVGGERLVDPTWTVGLRGTYRRLNRAIDDRCDFDVSRGLNRCAFVNPGSSGAFASGQVPTCNGFLDNPAAYGCSDSGPATPRASRIYRGIELLTRKTVTDRLWVQASYVYSSLRGNYDGGVNETFGTTTPGFNRDFDYPSLWHDASGRPFLDRPNRFRLDGYWVSPLRLSVGLQAYAVSGPPLDQIGYFNVIYGPGVYLVPRGSVGRLPTQWDANLTLAYPIEFGPTTVTLQAYVFNLFNNQIAMTRDNAWTLGPGADYPASILDPAQPQTNPEYGKNTSRTPPRQFRAAVRVSF